MSRTVGEWKAYASRVHGILWQPNFFDHRIRSDNDFTETWHYIRRNPVAKNLCACPEFWAHVWWPGSAGRTPPDAVGDAPEKWQGKPAGTAGST
jgi:hypothetical protein